MVDFEELSRMGFVAPEQTVEQLAFNQGISNMQEIEALKSRVKLLEDRLGHVEKFLLSGTFLMK